MSRVKKYRVKSMILYVALIFVCSGCVCSFAFDFVCLFLSSSSGAVSNVLDEQFNSSCYSAILYPSSFDDEGR